MGEPGAYAHLRMLDDITKVGVRKGSLPGNTPIQLAIVIPQCSDIVPDSGPTLLNHQLSPEIEENSYEVVRQSLAFFQSYLLAISDGELRLELNFYKINSCFQINKNNPFKSNYNLPLETLPASVINKTDMFWHIYSMDFDAGINYGFSSGIGSYNKKPVFISEDDWIIKKERPIKTARMAKAMAVCAQQLSDECIYPSGFSMCFFITYSPVGLNINLRKLVINGF